MFFRIPDTIEAMVRAEAIAQEFFGQASASIEALPGLGSVNEIFVAQFPQKRIIIRLPKPEDQHRAAAFYEKEAWCLAQAAAREIPSPRVLQLGTHDGGAYQILSFVDGVNGEQSALAPNVLWHALGEYAQRFHALAPTGFGETLPELLAPDGTARWLGFVDYNLTSLAAQDDPLVALGVYAPEQREAIKARFLALRQGDFTLGLCHGDLAPRNTILAPEGTLVLLDWGCAEAHLVPHYDLLNVPNEHREAFLDGYGWPTAERAALLAEVENLALLKSFDLVRWAIDRCPERIAELAAMARTNAQAMA
jgi:aminoglycoside phosphotransferase (APT) family kinase protein